MYDAAALPREEGGSWIGLTAARMRRTYAVKVELKVVITVNVACDGCRCTMYCDEEEKECGGGVSHLRGVKVQSPSTGDLMLKIVFNRNGTY